MLCQSCNERQANVHVTQVVNGARTELHLCQQCAEKRGELQVLAGPKFAFSNLVAGLLQSGGAAVYPVGIPGGVRRRCATCETDYADFTNSGFLGCSDCYAQFEPMLRPIIAQVHGHTRHTGKAPVRSGNAFRFRRELETLRADLKRLISLEEYEQAAKVRDRIRELETRQQKQADPKPGADSTDSTGGGDNSAGGSGSGGDSGSGGSCGGSGNPDGGDGRC
ncbi:MAG: UvrB/uvrC motif protein [Firmicutes bacterium ADurb.Bin506]|nr:MAG: UvrB/uvrC motif protein [Firmicutes bacterium ADurb.Bin506]